MFTEPKIKTVSFDVSVAELFADYLKKHDIKQITVVKSLGVSRSLISSYLVGRYPLSDSFRAKMNNYLGTDF